MDIDEIKHQLDLILIDMNRSIAKVDHEGFRSIEKHDLYSTLFHAYSDIQLITIQLEKKGKIS